MDSNTIVSLKPRANPGSPRVQIRAINSNRHRWKQDSLTWLNKVRSEGFECTEGHTLQIRGGYRETQFNIFVCEQVSGPIPPLPPKIYFDHWEIEAPFGHAISAYADKSPASIKVLKHFWGHVQEGDPPHFESMVMPLIDELVASFSEGESWAS